MSSFGGPVDGHLHCPGVQDERATRHSVDDRSLHQLCHRHPDSLQPPGATLDCTWSSPPLSAQQLTTSRRVAGPKCMLAAFATIIMVSPAGEKMGQTTPDRCIMLFHMDAGSVAYDSSESSFQIFKHISCVLSRCRIT